jgi:hypothetical protein
MEDQVIITTALSFINAIRRETGEKPLAAGARVSLKDPPNNAW